MKKYLISMLLLVSLAGCGEKEETNEPSERDVILYTEKGDTLRCWKNVKEFYPIDGFLRVKTSDDKWIYVSGTVIAW